MCNETLKYVVNGDVAGCGDEHFPVEDVDRLMYEFGQGGRLPVDRMGWDGMEMVYERCDSLVWFGLYILIILIFPLILFHIS